jgi:Bacterial regulatory proteins, luxR family
VCETWRPASNPASGSAVPGRAWLFLSERTVETHITNSLNKLGPSSRIQLGRWVADLTELPP